jgi:hypothetical protein
MDVTALSVLHAICIAANGETAHNGEDGNMKCRRAIRDIGKSCLTIARKTRESSISARRTSLDQKSATDCSDCAIRACSCRVFSKRCAKGGGRFLVVAERFDSST